MDSADDAPRGASPNAPWYERAFRSSYLGLYAHRSATAARKEIAGLAAALALSPASHILDLCCGAARHSIALREQGFHPVGLDLSLELLEQAARSQMRVARADMRRLPLRSASFDFVLQLFTSFGYFESEEENSAVLAEVARVLHSGGRSVLDLMHKQYVLDRLVPRSEELRDGELWIQERTYDASRRRVEKRVRRRFKSGGAEEWTESVAVYEPSEITALLAAAGFEVEAIWGSLAGGSFDADADRMVVISRR